MKLFKLENTRVQLDPEILLIPEFKKIWERDKSKSKEKAFSEFEYIYFSNDWASPYRVYTNIMERKDKVKKDYIKEDGWKEDSVIAEAERKYAELTKTPIMGLIEDAYTMVSKLRQFFLTADFTKLDRMGKRVDKATEGMKNLEQLGKVVESLQKLEQMAAAEKFEKSTFRGGKEAAYDDE